MLIALFIVLILGFIALFVYGIRELEAGICVIGSFGFVISVAISFGVPFGPDVIAETTAFTLEHTPYRLILTPLGLPERTWTDAYTVSHFDRIKAIRITTPHNVWGVELTSQRSFVPIISD